MHNQKKYANRVKYLIYVYLDLITLFVEQNNQYSSCCDILNPCHFEITLSCIISLISIFILSIIHNSAFGYTNWFR